MMRVIKQNVLTVLFTVSATFATMTAGAVPFNVVSILWDETVGEKVESILSSEEEIAKNKEREEKAKNIDTYFASMNLPLAGYGAAFVASAEKYDLDYRLLPAIAMRESTGGKFGCPFGNEANVFGWHSCKTKFKTYEEAIDKVAEHLAGEIKTTRGFYANKSVRQKLRIYNSVIPPYVDQVIAIMNRIEKAPVYESLAKMDKKDLKEVAVK